MQDHSKYDKVFALIDTGCIVVSDEFKKDLVHKVETLANKGVRIVLCNFWESEDQILKTDYPYLLRDYDFDVWHGGTTYFWYHIFSFEAIRTDLPISIYKHEFERSILRNFIKS